MHRHELNVLLAALALLLGALSLDRYLERTYPQNSRTLTVMELRSGGNTASQEKVAIRREHVEAVVALVADPANPLAMSAEERAHALQALQLIERLLAQAVWSADRLRQSMSPEERRRVEELWGDSFLSNQGQRSPPSYFEERLAEAYALPAPPPTRVPAEWTPEDDSDLKARWAALRRAGGAATVDTLLDFDARALVLALAVDQKEHPVRGARAEERYALAAALAEAAVNVDDQWKKLYALLAVSGSGRGEVLPPAPTELRPEDDLPLPDLMRRLREHLRALQEGV